MRAVREGRRVANGCAGTAISCVCGTSWRSCRRRLRAFGPARHVNPKISPWSEFYRPRGACLAVIGGCDRLPLSHRVVGSPEPPSVTSVSVHGGKAPRRVRGAVQKSSPPLLTRLLRAKALALLGKPPVPTHPPPCPVQWPSGPVF
jgi:hypothetical protein